jgi:predicted nucleotidyltransferase
MENINMEIIDFISIFKDTLLEKCENIIGIYLFGSLAYGGFDEKTSDIDLAVVTKTFLNKIELEIIKNIHEKLNSINKKWANRLEVSYIPIEMLKEKNIPMIDRPYFNEIFYERAGYGNEWLINNYLLIHYGKTIYGPEFGTLIKYDLNIEDIKESCINDFYKEWLPKINDDKWLLNSNNQSYIILNICRIINTIYNSKTENKQNSAKWVKENYKEWSKLIEEAEKWDYNKIMEKQNEIKEYIKYMEKIISSKTTNVA